MFTKSEVPGNSPSL